MTTNFLSTCGYGVTAGQIVIGRKEIHPIRAIRLRWLFVPRLTWGRKLYGMHPIDSTPRKKGSQRCLFLFGQGITDKSPQDPSRSQPARKAAMGQGYHKILNSITRDPSRIKDTCRPACGGSGHNKDRGGTTLELRGVQLRKDLVPRKADGKSGLEALCLELYQIGSAKNTKPPKAELPLLGGTYMATISESTFPSLSRDHKERDHLLKSKKVWEDNGSYRVFVATSGREVTRSERRLVPSLPPCMNASRLRIA